MIVRQKPLKITAFLVLLLAFVSVGASQGQPQLESISIYDVTDVSGEERYTGGELLASGTNTTFLLNQTEDRRDLRFSFEVMNNADQDWNLTSEDLLFHEGLDPNWNIPRIWYNVSETEYEGGSFSQGNLSWDTQDGANLSSTGTLYAKYIAEVHLTSSQEYDQRFVASDSSNSESVEDEHILDLNRLGSVSVTIEQPPNETVLTQNKTFNLNSTISCSGGECGDLTATPRYNQSAEADTVIPEDSGEPFHTVDPNLETCGNLLAGEECNASWKVNATADDSTSHLLDVNASSSYGEIGEQDSADTDVTVNQVVLMNMSWDTTDFGLLDPGDRARPAAGNEDLSYNITLLENSNEADIWVKGRDLVSESDPDYSIPIDNMNYSLENLQTESEPVKESYQSLKSSVSAGTLLNTFYWLDVPTGIVEGDYNGSITFKANISS